MNLFKTAEGAEFDLSLAIEKWIGQRNDYTYDSNVCGKECRHYKQMVWATTENIGCALHLCPTLTTPGGTKVTEDNVKFLVCNYSPAGNVKDEKPYIKGAACSKCGSGAGWCKDKLCKRECKSAGDECSCAAHCYNCATFDSSTCKCTCANGWHGVDCKVPCKDTGDNCDDANKGKCNDESHPDVKRNCPALCDLCTADPDATADKCEPVFGPDAHTLATTTPGPSTGTGTGSGISTTKAPTTSAQSTFIVAQQAMITLPMVLVALAVNYNTAL